MLGARDGYRQVPWFWSDQYDLNVQMSGHNQPTDTPVYRGDPSSLSFTTFYLHAGAISAVVGINRPRDVRATTRLIEARPGGAAFDPCVRQQRETYPQGPWKGLREQAAHREGRAKECRASVEVFRSQMVQTVKALTP